MQVEEKSYTTNSPDATMDLAESLAQRWRPGTIVCLSGQLGAGKTHFVKGAVRAFDIDEREVQSPTFTLINQYDGRLPVYHFDCYRLENERQFWEIGAEEYLFGEGVSIIEWPERIAAFLPDEALGIYINTAGKNKRIFKVEKSYTNTDL